MYFEMQCQCFHNSESNHFVKHLAHIIFVFTYYPYNKSDKVDAKEKFVNFIILKIRKMFIGQVRLH